ncbi:MAG: glycoside hydrolase family 97 catalytic domain-containing protein [Sedimentisphaerales bacterium]|nr:glycoside hydrolase family 97 catalytic domain-containing protein [Sedimentisphaerales bacterium]
MKFRLTTILVVCLTLAARSAGVEPVTLQSPDGAIRAIVYADEAGRLMYRLQRGEQTVIEPSRLGPNIDGVALGEPVELGPPKRFSFEERYPWRGAHATAVNHYAGAAIPVTQTTAKVRYILEFRVFADGVGFRYILPGEGGRTVRPEATTFTVPAGSEVWFQTNTNNYEGFYQRYRLDQIEPGTYLGPPLVVVLPHGQGYAAISEAALFDYSGMTLKAQGGGSPVFEAAFQDDDAWTIEGTITTPWRVVMISPDLNGLVNCDIIWNLCPPPPAKLAEATWIKPGRALWHWWSGKIGNWDSVAFPLQKGWIDAAAEFGFEYYLVDAGWEHTWTAPGKDKWAHLRELCDYAKQKQVGVIVWKRWKSGRTEGADMTGLDDEAERRDFFRRCRQAGVVGVKIDFMDSESLERIRFYQAALKDAAEYQLLVNFHGANKPTGEARTWPNEIAREGVRGLEYNKWSELPPSHYATLCFTRFLAGHGDFTPVTFNPEMLKGTTFALQLASAVAFTCPLIHFADRPELYRQSPAQEVLRSIPSVWDETRVLPESEIGELAALARRTAKVWFVGIMNGSATEAKTYALDLSFLGPGSYRAILLGDDPGRPDAFQRRSQSVKAGDSLEVKMNPGGGFVGMFEPQ